MSLLYIHYLTTCICLYIYTACLQQYSRNHGNSVSLFKYITDLFVYGMRHTALWSCSHIPNIIDLSQKKKCYGPDKKILFKRQLFDHEVKDPRRSLRYETHRLMVMHSHTKYIWPIWKDKKVMVRTSFAEKKLKKKITLKQYMYVSPRGDIIKYLSINTCIPHPLLGCNNQHGFLDLRRETTCRSRHH